MITRSLPLEPYNIVRHVPDARVAPKNGTPKIGDRARRQNVARVAGVGGFGSVCGTYDTSSGNTVSECSFPYWHMMLWGTEAVYRLIASLPTPALARYIVLGPVRASTWDYTWSDLISDGDPAVRFVKNEILPMRRAVMREAVRTFDFGYQPFGNAWEIRDKLYYPALRALLPESTTILEDEAGHFAGILNQGVTGKEVRLNNLESWVPSLDGEAGYKYGRSRYENIRATAWANWLETLVRMNELQKKLSGILPIVTHSPDGYKGDDDVAVNYSTEANTLLEYLTRATGVRIESSLNINEVLAAHGEQANIDKIIDASAIRVKFYDAGNVAQALPGFIQKLEYLDKLMFRGLLRPERSGLEAVAAGSRADSEQHTATGTADSEAIDADLTESFDENVVRTALRLNFGEDAARNIHVISSPLQERKQAIFWQLIDRVMSSDPETAAAIAITCDMDAMLTQNSIPTLKKKFAEALAETRELKAKQAQAAKPAAQPKQPTEQQVSAIQMALESMAQR